MAIAGRVDRFRALLVTKDDEVIDVNAAAKDSQGMTPLMYAAEGGHVHSCLSGSGAQ